MSHIFLSHSSQNNAQAVALYDWLGREGWKDEIFLDLDPQRGIAAGERWERSLHEAANRCEAVLFLVSKAWLASVWCRKELNLAHHLNKRLFGVLIEDLPVGELPEDLTGTWQIVRLAAGRDHVVLRAVLPITHEEAHVHTPRVCSASNTGWRKPASTPSILPGRRRAIQIGHPIAACARSKPRMPAFSLAAVDRSWKHSIGCAACARPPRRGSS
jgi:hypothetical protein